MSTAEGKTNKSFRPTLKGISYWFVICFTILLISFLAYIAIEEWYIVAIIKKDKGYPWGEINDNPWYYKSAQSYSGYMLFNAITMLIGLVTLTYALLKKRKSLAKITVLCLWVFLILLIVNGQSNHFI